MANFQQDQCIIEASRIRTILEREGGPTWSLLHMGPQNSWPHGSAGYIMVWQRWTTGEVVVLQYDHEIMAFRERIKREAEEARAQNAGS